MSDQAANAITSIEELIANLEHIEESELKSDIRQNVRAEVKRMKRNVSAILSFTAYSRSQQLEPALQQAIVEVRRECLAVNATISKFLILQMLHAEAWAEYGSRVLDQYSGVVEAARQMCALAAPMRVQELAGAL